MTGPRLDGHYFMVPNGIHRAVAGLHSPAYTLSCLLYLMRCANGTGECFPSYAAMTQGIMSRRQAINAIDDLGKAGLITITKTPYHANTFKVNLDAILDTIIDNTPTSERGALVNDVHQSTSELSAPPSECGSPPVVNDVHHINTQLINTQDKDVSSAEAPPKKETPEEYRERAAGDPRYAGVDVPHEYEKCAAWCADHRQKPTTLRFIRWLDRALLDKDKGNGHHPPAEIPPREKYHRPEDIYAKHGGASAPREVTK